MTYVIVTAFPTPDDGYHEKRGGSTLRASPIQEDAVMTSLTLTTLDAGQRTIGNGAMDALRDGVDGAVLLPGDAGYDDARTIWNAMVDKRPGAVVRCATAADVARAVGFAAEHHLLLAIKGGGHNIAGNAVCDGGLMLDLSPMKTVEVDPDARTARVQPGARLADVDAATQAHGLAVPLGINSTTGIAGLTLGGGFGWLSRKYGLTIDSLEGADIVTPDGQSRRASAAENPELFWAIRGGGGNFGVVTSFDFKLHEVGPEVLSGLVVHPLAAAPDLMRDYRRLAAAMPDELTVWVVMRKAPPLPFLPEEWHGREVLVFAACYAGDMAEGEQALAPLRALGEPIADVIGPHPYAGWQQAFDPLLTEGARNYWKSHNFDAIDDGLIDVLLEAIGRLPGPECEVFIGQLGGATMRRDPAATAFAHRQASFVMNVHTRWQDPARDTPCIAWARELFDRTARFATGGVYVNFMPEDETGRVKGAFGASYDRLARIKAAVDPGNLLRMNMNIRPAA
jgi:FAD/FMN-containing dehydrogenase